LFTFPDHLDKFAPSRAHPSILSPPPRGTHEHFAIGVLQIAPLKFIAVKLMVAGH